MKLLDKTILSHLLVALPPAAILGWTVIDINTSALELETQMLHLSLATQLRETIGTTFEVQEALLGHAERVLDMTDLPIEQRQDVLRALVADGHLPHLAIHGPDGAFDTIIRPKDEGDVDRSAIPEALRKAAEAGGFAVSPLRERGDVLLVVPWKRDAEVLGFLATSLDPKTFEDTATKLARNYLGEKGVIETVDGLGNRVLSSEGAKGAARGPGSMFTSIDFEGGGLTKLETGISTRFEDERGEPRLASIVSKPSWGWVVGTSRPVSVALASIERVRTRVILLSALAALAAGFVGLILARSISVPIQALAASVVESARRGFVVEARQTGSGELAELAQAFNLALKELDRHRKELRQTTQLRLRLSRMVAGGSMHDLLATSEKGEAKIEQLTVLYADVVYAQATGQPEAATEHLVTQLGEFFSAAHEAIRRHGGKVDRFSGDAMIGIFTTGSDGDGARAALAAGRDLVEDARSIASRWRAVAKTDFEAAVGIVSGEGRLTFAPDSAEVSVSGELVELAQSAESRASPGTILVDASTRGLLGGHATLTSSSTEGLWIAS